MKILLKENKKNKRNKCFLGGTCADSTWREDLIPKLEIDFFNPVVKDWKPEDYDNELRERAESKYHLYVITPKMEGVYSIAETIDSTYKLKSNTIFCYLKKDGDKEFTKGQLKSLEAVGKMVVDIGGLWAKDLDEIAEILNK